MTVQTYAAGDDSVAQWFFKLFLEKDSPPFFLRGSTFLQSGLARKKTAAKTGLPQSVPAAVQELLYFNGTGYVQKSLQDSCIHTKTAPKNGELDWIDFLAGESGLECAIEVHWPGKVPDCSLALPHLPQYMGRAAQSDVT